jgi:hypothetical protein
VLELPHPLLPDGVDVERLLRDARAKYTLAPHTNITIAITNGIPVQISSSASDPWIGSPDSSGCRRRYLIAKNTTSTVTTTAKNALTAIMKKYRLSTRAATVEAWSGNNGMVGSMCLR